MTVVHLFTVTVDPVAMTATLAGPTWSHTMGASQLTGWVKLYRNLRDRKNGAFKEFYAQPTAALEAAQKEIFVLEARAKEARETA